MNVSGATSLSYTVAAADVGKYLRCTVTGKGSYTGSVDATVNSTVRTGLKSATLNVTSYKVGAAVSVAIITLNDTAGTVITSPGTTNFSYQWQNSSDNTNWTNIALNGSSISYTPVAADSGKYLRCYILGTNTYGGSAIASASSTVLIPLSGATLDKSANVATGDIIKVSTVTDYSNAAATVNDTNMTFQWQTSSDNTSWTDISGTTNLSYTVVAADAGKYLRCAVTGKGSYTGTIYTAVNGTILTGLKSATLNATSYKVGTAVSVATITLNDTSNTIINANTTNFTYQWQNSSDNVTWSNIALNGTSISYTPVAADSGKYLRCYILGTNAYGGSAIAAASSTVLMPLSGATLDKTAGVAVGNTLTVNAATDYTNTAVTVNTTNMTFQWQTSSDNTNWADISGAASASYTTTISNLSSYLRCAVTGAGGYTATIYTGATNALTVPIASATLNTNSPQISQPVSVSTITLGDADNTQPPVDTANFTYQWQTATALAGPWSNITGVTGTSYTPVAADRTKYLKCVITGTNAYTGSVGVNTTSTVSPITVTGITISTANPIAGSTVTVTSITDEHGQAVDLTTYTDCIWQISDTGAPGSWQDIPTAIGTISYTPTGADIGKYLQCYTAFPGTSPYIGIVTATAASTVQANTLAAATLSGTAQSGSPVLVASVTDGQGQAVAINATNLDLQWQISLDNAAWTNITGATGTNYTVAATDAGKYLRCVLTGKDAYIGSTAMTPSTQVAAPPAPPAPPAPVSVITTSRTTVPPANNPPVDEPTGDTTAPPEYAMTQGGNATWTPESGKALLFSTTAPAGSLTEVYVDGKLIPRSAYTLSQGGTVIELTDTYLATLASGKHTLKFVFSDNGSAETTFTISPPASDKTEKEGMGIGTWLLIGGGVLVAAGAIVWFRRRTK